MNEDDLTKIMDSIQQKIGVENSATIADDLGMLITKNSETLKTMSSQNDKIKELQDKNEKLVISNGNLLKQIDMAEDYSTSFGQPQKEEEPKPFSMKACFDSQGNFIN